MQKNKFFKSFLTVIKAFLVRRDGRFNFLGFSILTFVGLLMFNSCTQMDQAINKTAATAKKQTTRQIAKSKTTEDNQTISQAVPINAAKVKKCNNANVSIFEVTSRTTSATTPPLYKGIINKASIDSIRLSKLFNIEVAQDKRLLANINFIFKAPETGDYIIKLAHSDSLVEVNIGDSPVICSDTSSLSIINSTGYINLKKDQYYTVDIWLAESKDRSHKTFFELLYKRPSINNFITFSDFYKIKDGE